MPELPLEGAGPPVTRVLCCHLPTARRTGAQWGVMGRLLIRVPRGVKEASRSMARTASRTVVASACIQSRSTAKGRRPRRRGPAHGGLRSDFAPGTARLVISRKMRDNRLIRTGSPDSVIATQLEEDRVITPEVTSAGYRRSVG